MNDIIHQTARHYAIQTAKGYEVYRHEGVTAVKCATIGFKGQEGIRRTLAEMARREQGLWAKA